MRMDVGAQIAAVRHAGYLHEVADTDAAHEALVVQRLQRTPSLHAQGGVFGRRRRALGRSGPVEQAQVKILSRKSAVVRSGGRLAVSTCRSILASASRTESYARCRETMSAGCTWCVTANACPQTANPIKHPGNMPST